MFPVGAVTNDCRLSDLEQYEFIILVTEARVLSGSRWTRAQEFSSRVQGDSGRVPVAASINKTVTLQVTGPSFPKCQVSINVNMLLLQLVP